MIRSFKGECGKGNAFGARSCSFTGCWLSAETVRHFLSLPRFTNFFRRRASEKHAFLDQIFPICPSFSKEQLISVPVWLCEKAVTVCSSGFSVQCTKAFPTSPDIHIPRSASQANIHVDFQSTAVSLEVRGCSQGR